MKPDAENFENLRQLLALKRYEQPPPRFFDELPRRVIAQLEADRARSVVPWWERLWLAIETKPAFAGAFGALAGAVLITSLVVSQPLEANPALAIKPLNDSSWLMASPAPISDSESSPFDTFRAGRDSGSTSPVLSLGTPAGFLQPATLSVQPVAFTPAPR